MFPPSFFSVPPVSIPLKRSFFARVFLALMFGAVLSAPARTPLSPEPDAPQISARFARLFPSEHLSRHDLDDTISAQAWTNFLNGLDYEHLYFLDADIQALSAHQTALDDQLIDGDLHVPYAVYEMFLERVAERYAFVTNLLETGFDLDKDESYTWKRKASPWPKTSEERDDLWRRKIKNEYVQRLVAVELGDTNAPPPSTTNTLAIPVLLPAEATNAPPIHPPTPTEAIRNRYEQLLTVLNDNDADWVFQKFLTAFTHAYDPHSSYMSPASLEDFNIDMRLSLVGIGALLASEDGAAKVERIIPGGPADRDKRDKRLQAGDKIIAVGQDDQPPVSILHWPLQKAVEKIRGKKGTRVVLVVIPGTDPTESTTKTVDLTRDEVHLEEQAAAATIVSVAASDGVTRKLGIITLPTFYADIRTAKPNGSRRSAADDVEAILREMTSASVQGILLDLRNNGGGALMEAVKMTGLFIDEGPVVQVRERYGRRVLMDLDPRVVYDGPLVVLVNRLSASASEILAGALQDYRRAVIVGDSKTHGKGTVQTVESVGRERLFGAIKVTSACFFRVTGSSTQVRGVSSDIVLPSPLDRMELGEEFLPNAMEWTSINAAPFVFVPNPVTGIEPLRMKSEARRNEDPLFLAYRQFLDRVSKLQETAAMPLNVDTRRDMARTEKELSALQEELAMSDIMRADDDPSDDRDLILSESLHILADLAALTEITTTAEPVPTPEPPSFWMRLQRWIDEAL